MGPLANGRFKVEEPVPFQLDQGSWRRLGRRLVDKSLKQVRKFCLENQQIGLGVHRSG
jgi:hypothetical protein